MAQHDLTPMTAVDSDELPSGAGWIYEPKWDGLRCLVSVDADGAVALSSARGESLTDAFPELVAAARMQLPANTIVDGEIVRWNEQGRMEFAAVQRRIEDNDDKDSDQSDQLAISEPCQLILFDMLHCDGRDLTRSPLVQRRLQLEQLVSSDEEESAVLVLSQQTEDLETAQAWFGQIASLGIEGVVAKRAHEPYRQLGRTWRTVDNITATQAIVGGVIGQLKRPKSLIVGRIRRIDGQLHIAGRTGQLDRSVVEEIAGKLAMAGDSHPWAKELPTSWAERNYHRVIPRLVIEVRTDVSATNDPGEPTRWRHRVDFVRIRSDLAAYDVPLDLDVTQR